MENLTESVVSLQQENCFLIDWLTFTAYGCTLDDCKEMLGLSSKKIRWENSEKFRNGYPMQCYWNGVTISYGAEDPRHYKDPRKARNDMGICVNLSGTGCRAFETYGKGDWFILLSDLFTLRDHGAREKHGRIYSYNITRLDLAYDDHSGILDIYRIESDIRERNYISPSKYSEILWSDKQDEDIQGMTCQVGSDKSDIKIRIYNKAAERGFKDRHWIRCELQLRDDRARIAAENLIKFCDIGHTVSGILLNYLTFRVPSDDSNKSRWPIAVYWLDLLTSMEKIKLWISPGEEYNFRNTEHWLMKQYGQAIVVLDEINENPHYLIDSCRRLFPVKELAPKYQEVLKLYGRAPKPYDIIDTNIDDNFWFKAVQQDVLEGF